MATRRSFLSPIRVKKVNTQFIPNKFEKEIENNENTTTYTR